MKKITFEVCAENIDAVRAAIIGGADRVELCRELDLDGLTPHVDTIREAVALAQESSREFGVMVLVRQRDGDFIYNAEEKRIMTDDIKRICHLGVDGIVIGALTPALKVDTQWTKAVTEIAHSQELSVTFHRAFDRAANLYDALECLVDIGVDRILTSGGQPDVVSGIEILTSLNRLAAGRISIMPGGSVRSSNISRLYRNVGASEYHGSCRQRLANGEFATDPEEIKRIIDILNQ